MLRTFCAASATLALVGGLLAAAPIEADAATPSRISSVRATPGPGAGQVTFHWRTEGKNTSAFKIETGLTSFSKSPSSPLPTSGRHAKVFTVDKSRRSVTLTAAQVQAAGASARSGNHLYYRFFAVNGSTKRAYPRLQAVLPKPVTPVGSSVLRMATFNVLSAKAASGRLRWTSRATDVAREIKTANPGIVALQELGPGRADGRNGVTTGRVRQTTSLVRALRGVGAGKYRLVRETPYVAPGSIHGTQGARILYDTTRYTLISGCSEKTRSRNYSSSCSMDLPRLAGDSRKRTRSAAYARLQDRRTGVRLWVASVHLDDRHSGNLARERAYDNLRNRQIAAVYGRIAQLNTAGDRVIVAGDINSWQNNKAGNSPHDRMIGAGFADTSSAPTRVNAQYPTINHSKSRLTPSSLGVGTRIDVILVKGAKGTRRFENMTRVVDADRPSDHNLVLSDIVL